jgi:hypothetical protein
VRHPRKLQGKALMSPQKCSVHLSARKNSPPLRENRSFVRET